MPDYSKGKIYTIRNYDDIDLIYVGSTAQKLTDRFGQHKRDCIKYPNLLLYSKVNNNWNNWYIELHENYPCITREELGRREGEVMRELKATLNKKIEGRTQKEYYIDNKKERLDYQNQYYQYNKDECLNYQHQYNKDHKDERLNYQHQYNKDHKDKILEYKKQYYLQNKDKYKQLYFLRKQNKDINAEP